MPVPMTSPRQAAQARVRRQSSSRKLNEAVMASALPAGAALFALLFTALVAQWASSAYDPSLAPKTARQQHAAKYTPKPENGTAAGPTSSAGGAPSSKNNVAYAAPFLSDLLPESDGGKKKPRPLTKEEQDLSKSEAVYKHNMIRRSEIIRGVRPELPYEGWNAGRLKEVFLTATYPCPHTTMWGSSERGKFICNPEKLATKPPVIIYSFGALEDLSFEQTAYNTLGPSTKIHVFSPYLSAKAERELMAPKSAASKFLASFSPFGVGAKDALASLKKGNEASKEFYTFPWIMHKTGDTHIDIVKIDCEGCEEQLFPELAKTYSRSQPPFDQVIVECHQIARPERILPVLFALEDMGFRLFHVAPDRRTSTKRFELSFVHEHFLYPHRDEKLIN